MNSLFVDMSALDGIIVFFLFILSHFVYDKVKTFVHNRLSEECTVCGVRISVRPLSMQSRVMLDHYEKLHPQIVEEARKE